MSSWLEVILLGIIEGITEFLPVSSTGHLLIAQRWLTPRGELFNVVIQCGAVIAVLPLFWPRIAKMLQAYKDRDGRDYALKIAVAFGITAVGGLVLKKLGWELDEDPLPVALALVIGGVLFIAVERWLRDRSAAELVTWGMAAAVGVAQLVAGVFPGSSRSGTTILIMLAMGLARPAATEFTFLVGIPTILAAGAYETYKSLSAAHMAPAESPWSEIAVATAVSAVVSFVVVKWLLGYVRSHTFTVFGWYRIVAGLALIGLLLLDR